MNGVGKGVGRGGGMRSFRSWGRVCVIKRGRGREGVRSRGVIYVDFGKGCRRFTGFIGLLFISDIRSQVRIYPRQILRRAKAVRMKVIKGIIWESAFCAESKGLMCLDPVWGFVL